MISEDDNGMTETSIDNEGQQQDLGEHDEDSWTNFHVSSAYITSASNLVEENIYYDQVENGGIEIRRYPLKEVAGEVSAHEVDDDDDYVFNFNDHSINEIKGDQSPAIKSGSIPIRRKSRVSLRQTRSSADADDHQVENQFEQQDQSVKCIKILVFSLLLASAAAVTTLVFWYTRENEQKLFESEHENLATKVKDAFRHNLDMKVWSGRTLSAMLVKEGMYTGHNWPNVTMPAYEEQTISLLLLSHAWGIGFSPLVTNEAKKQWEAYAVENYKTAHMPSMQLDQKAKNRLLEPLSDMFGMEENGMHHTPEGDSGTQHNDDAKSKGYMNKDKMNQDKGQYDNDKSLEIFPTKDGLNEDYPGSYRYLPLWQIAPVRSKTENKIMSNLRSFSKIQEQAIKYMLSSNHPTLTEFMYYQKETKEKVVNYAYSVLFYPITEDFSSESQVVGSVQLWFDWSSILRDILPANDEIICVIETSTGQSITYRIEGIEPKFEEGFDVGKLKYLDKVHRDDHQHDYILHGIDYHTADDHHEGSRPNDNGIHSDEGSVTFSLKIYPADKLGDRYFSRNPIMYASIVLVVFLFTSLTFILYAWLMEQRQTAVIKTAERSYKIVDNLFPASVRDRLFRSNDERIPERPSSDFPNVDGEQYSKIKNRIPTIGHPTRRFSNSSGKSDAESGASVQFPPIADLFTDTTIIFADIAGFTAWSSEREPTQVFQLLEALFQEFDNEAKKLGVFKVETIGDCYVAVAGVPNHCIDHALVMTNFALKIMYAFHKLIYDLELSLGPGTAELGIRCGLHSGPVTGGVLRGDKSRFQLFGDTMNTASRMESTGKTDTIQVSQATADLLIAAGASQAIAPREDLVEAKGKGMMQTYWILKDKASNRHSHEILRRRSLESSTSPDSLNKNPQPMSSLAYSTSGKDVTLNEFVGPVRLQPSKVVQRLITWNGAILEQRLVNVLLYRTIQGKVKRTSYFPNQRNDNTPSFSDEVTNAIYFPPFDLDSAQRFDAIQSSSYFRKPGRSLTQDVRKELLDYVARIALMYRNVHFHNFQHASHVAMSANKLMNKVCVGNTGVDGTINNLDSSTIERTTRHFFSTFGISSDPLAQLAIVFAALVHDVDHTGAPNAVLIREKPALGLKYNSKSVAENNSIDIAWSLLMKPDFNKLRKCMFADDNEKSRFRQLLNNALIATDIADHDRMSKERVRWENALSNISSWEDVWQGKGPEDLVKIDVSLKATVVLEHIVQASDVAHAMQHWLTFVKWNERLCMELWSAFVSGRTDKDPTLGWYEDQLSFFDGYIIPLASKLKECGVFGTAGKEYLGNALTNRQEWEEKGKDISARLTDTIKTSSDDAPNYWTHSYSDS